MSVRVRSVNVNELVRVDRRGRVVAHRWESIGSMDSYKSMFQTLYAIQMSEAIDIMVEIALNAVLSCGRIALNAEFSD